MRQECKIVRPAGACLRLTITAAILALTACSSADAPPGAPGSLTAHMNGQVVATFGHSAR